MTTMRLDNLAIEPEPDSELERQLADLQALQVRAYAEQQVDAHLRDAHQRALTTLRRAMYRPDHMRPSPLELEQLEAQAMEVEARMEQHRKASAPLLRQLRDREDQFERTYTIWLQQVAVTDRQRRLGARNG
jgi:hypothetical protein